MGCIQEGSEQEAEELHGLVGGRLWFVAACGCRPRNVGVLVHSRWCARKAQPSISGLLARLQLCLLTPHSPHAHKSDVEYEAALAGLGQAVEAAKRQRKQVVVGVDAKAVYCGRRITII